MSCSPPVFRMLLGDCMPFLVQAAQFIWWLVTIHCPLDHIPEVFSGLQVWRSDFLKCILELQMRHCTKYNNNNNKHFCVLNHKGPSDIQLPQSSFDKSIFLPAMLNIFSSHNHLKSNQPQSLDLQPPSKLENLNIHNLGSRQLSIVGSENKWLTGKG